MYIGCDVHSMNAQVVASTAVQGIASLGLESSCRYVIYSDWYLAAYICISPDFDGKLQMQACLYEEYCLSVADVVVTALLSA